MEKITVPVPTEAESAKMAALLEAELTADQFAAVVIVVRPDLESA
ncbi:hypothetical protein [Paraburkholderia aspalathi]|nr:hypothetical protein [Paraburkholderia aspalathi]